MKMKSIHAYAGNDTLLYVKSSYRHVPEFMIRINNIEKKLRIKDYSIDNHFSYHDGKIVYASYRPAARWGIVITVICVLFMFQVAKNISLTNHTKYFSPDISQDGNEVIAVNELPDEKNSCICWMLLTDT